MTGEKVIPIGRKGKPPKGPPPKDWRKGLVLTERGHLAASAWNVGLILKSDPRVAGLFALNEFANRIETRQQTPWESLEPGEFKATDLTRLEQWLGSPDAYMLSAKPDMLERCVYAAAESQRFHPVRDWLKGLMWDGTERLPSLFPLMFGAENTPYAQQVGVAFGVSAVARALQHGCKVDFMVVLEGDQGSGKTSGVEALFSTPWYAEAQESPQSKDFYLALQGRWCVEIAEMHAFSRADTTVVKKAITARNDVFRAPYARAPDTYPRSCVFVGTTNEMDWQRDSTGGRRYYPIRCGPKVQVAELLRLRDQIWAEAVARYSRGDIWHQVPDGAAEVQEGAYQADAWENEFQSWLGGAWDDKYYSGKSIKKDAEGVHTTSMADLLHFAIGLDVARQTRAEQMRAAAILRRMKWDQLRVEAKGQKVRLWVKPPPF